jgi:hypothetical protein
MSFYKPGVSGINLLQEAAVFIPAGGGLAVPVTVQQTGFLQKLRLFLDAQVAQSAATGAPVKSAYGALGGSLKRIQVFAAGRKPFLSVSGLGLAYYNEMLNVDGSVFAPPPFLTGASDVVVAETAHLTAHTVSTTGATTYTVQQPAEVLFGLPVWMANEIRRGDKSFPAFWEEIVGLWYLAERKTQLTIDTEWYPAYVAAGPKAPYSAGTAAAATWSATVNRLRIERELLDVPPDPADWPSQTYVHQCVEYVAPITGKTFNFAMPQSGAVLRVGMIFLDSADALVDVSDLLEASWEYGSAEKPIARPGWACTHEFLHDYKRYPPKGLACLDFYKAGRGAARYARNSDLIANLAIKGTMSATTTGNVLMLVESLVPQRVMA